MFFYYRISDKSYRKEKLPGIGKRECLENFLSVFKRWNGIVLADNCGEDTLAMVREICKPLPNVSIRTSELGNAGALKWCIDHALENAEKLRRYRLYFVEDDYLHSPNAADICNEPLSLPGVSYATLFDHPDKYTQLYGFGETSKVFRGTHHWRMTQSTTMTFLANSMDLQRDYPIWEKYTSSSHPHDHQIFTEILMENEKLDEGKLVCAIPGAAVHTDLSVSIALAKVSIEPWAIAMSCSSLEKKAAAIDDEGSQETLATIIGTTQSGTWDRIKLLNALIQFQSPLLS